MLHSAWKDAAHKVPTCTLAASKLCVKEESFHQALSFSIAWVAPAGSGGSVLQCFHVQDERDSGCMTQPRQVMDTVKY